MSLSGAAADQWLPAQPGSERMIALGIARQIVSTGHYAGADADQWAAALDAYTPDAVADRSGIDAAMIERIAHEFATANPGLAIGGDAVGAGSGGTDALVAINVLNYLVGNVGQAGGVIFNPPPSVGAEASAHTASYRDMVALADDAQAGNIDVLIIHGTNPVHTMPASSGFAEALANVPTVVSLSSFMDDTTALAHIVLPSHTDLESWGDHAPSPGVGFNVAAISQPVVAPLFDTRAAGDTVLGMAQALDLGDGLSATDMHDYIRRGWQQIYRGDGAESDEGFEEFWLSVLRAGAWSDGARTDSAATTVSPDVVASTGGERLGDENALSLQPYLSVSLRDGRGANLPWMQELPDPTTKVVYGSWVELNPETAKALGISEGELVEVSSEHGTISAPALIYPAIMPGVAAMPIGQGHGDFGRYARNRGANPLAIIAPDADATSGDLAWAATKVTLRGTGSRAPLRVTGGNPRELGRDIVRTTGGSSHATLKNIPITVEPA